MKKRVAAILLLLSAASIALSVQKASDWIKHNSPEGRYSLLLPGPPTLGTQESATATGEKFTQYKATLEQGNTVFLVGYFDHVPGTVFSLDKARDGMLEAVKGTLLSESAISLEGSPGRQLKISANNPGEYEFLLLTRIYDIDKRVYVLQLIVPKLEDTSATADKAARFFDSFQVTKTR